jgi:probable rRNA maturation factor
MCPPLLFLLFRGDAARRQLRSPMILIEPAIEKKFGRTSLKKRAIGDFLTRAIEAAALKGRVSVLLTGDEEIRRLNREFRHKDQSTDVLSFPAAELAGRAKLAGDVAISVETAAREAEKRQHPLATELKILLLHGVLHLAGWDHEADAGEMAREEETLRRRLGLAQGLIDRTEHRAQGSGTRVLGLGLRKQVPTLRQKRAQDGAPRAVKGAKR